MTHRIAGPPLTDVERAQLWTLIGRLGEREAQALTGVSRETFARALAGLTVQRGSAALIRAALPRAA